jgi:hypothetical protein
MNTLLIEREIMSNWALVTREQVTHIYKNKSGRDCLTLSEQDPAEWNLIWLFEYDKMKLADGTYEGVVAHCAAGNPKVMGAIFNDLSMNPHGIKELAETLDPVSFIDTLMSLPYEDTALYRMCGAEIFEKAKVNAERLAEDALKKGGKLAEQATLDAIQKARTVPPK